MTTKSEKAAIIASGRAHLAQWLRDAEAHGTIYYSIPRVSRSGMSRVIKLYTILNGSDGKPALSQLWPSYDETAPGDSWSVKIDTVAKDWGFTFGNTRGFRVNGCGMDMVFWLVGHLANLAFSRESREGENYANRVRRDSIG
jgi:hypothetical protein